MNIDDVQYVKKISVSDYNMLRKSAGWNEIAKAQAQTGINNSAFLVSAKFEEKTVGMARLITDGGYIAIIVDVIVLPEFQRKGIGKTMMTMLMEYIQDSITKGEGVFINLMAAKGRESFYKQFGFIERPNDKLGSGMTKWISK